MELGNQIKKYRNNFSFSQEELAEKIYVSRQTISSWENNKSYPDIKSLTLLSSVFDVSLDILVKGDLEDMKEKIREAEIKTDDLERFKKDSRRFTGLFVYAIFLTLPIITYLGMVGKIIGAAAWVTLFYYGCKVDKMKKLYDIKTYKEIVAFMEGRRLSEIDRYKEAGKSHYQKFLLVCLFALLGFIISYISVYLFEKDTWSNMPWGYKFITLTQAASVVLLIDSTYDKMKEQKRIKFDILNGILILVYGALTVLVGMKIIDITPIVYCSISLFFLMVITFMFFISNKEYN